MYQNLLNHSFNVGHSIFVMNNISVNILTPLNVCLIIRLILEVGLLGHF